MNEAGSKDMPTLDFKGARAVALKEVHAQTRERWTACTAVLSEASAPAESVPLLVLFKGGEGILKALEAYQATTAELHSSQINLKVAVSNSGSMRIEHILDYLDFALQRRSGDNQWKVLLCDAYRAHIADSISRLAWKHRYIVVYIGGGATGVVQTNDTHLHGPLQQDYMALEQASMFEQMEADPAGCPVRTREQCLDDLARIWKRRALHHRSSGGFVQNQLLNALDGSQDHLASSEVAGFWDELEMNKWRDQVIQDVCDEWKAGRLDWSFESVHGLIEPFPATGHMDFYEEFQDAEGEAPGGDGAVAWNDNDGPSPVASDERGDDGLPSAPAGLADPPGPLNEAQQAEVQANSERLAALDRALEAAGGEVHVRRAIENVRLQVLREAAGRSQKDSAIAQAVRRQEQLSRDVDAARLQQAAERRRSSEAREAACEEVLASLDARVVSLIKREGEVAAKTGAAGSASEAAKLRAHREAVQAAARSFRLDELGQGKSAEQNGSARFVQNRHALVTRVFNLGDQRPPIIEANWKTWLHRFDERGRREWGVRWAARLRVMMSSLLEQMERGETDACLRWHAQMTRDWCLNAGALLVPGSLSPPPALAPAATSSASHREE